eukprot:5467086-Prorocentrum_lima.AAC.1
MAIDGNVADVSAKEGAQETAVTLTGLVLGLLMANVMQDPPAAGDVPQGFRCVRVRTKARGGPGEDVYVPAISDSQTLSNSHPLSLTLNASRRTAEMVVWAIFLLLTLLHVYANYKG